jgi:glycosyltransferase involved in cell wall biosynthesis
MSAERIRVAWLASYDVAGLQPEIAIRRRLRPETKRLATWIVNLADAIAPRDDIDLHLITASSVVDRGATVRRNGIAYHVVRHAFPCTCRGFPPYLRLDLWSRYAFLRRDVARLLRRLRPDLIHVHGTEYGYGLAALDTGLPTIVSIQGIVSCVARLSPTMECRLQAPIERHIIRNARYFGSRTAWATAFIRSLNGTAKVYDLPEAIADVFFRAGGGSRGHSDILMVGYVERLKGIEEALEAMRVVLAACPAARLRVVGAGRPGYLAQLRRRAESTGIGGSVDWLGFKSATEIAALHARSALLIHPSHLDNSPNSVAEAMASGLPVIASNVGGIPSLVQHDVTGLLVAPRSPRALAEAAIALLRDEPRRRRLAGRAMEVATERYLPAGVAAQTLRVYLDILGQEQQTRALDRSKGHRDDIVGSRSSPRAPGLAPFRRGNGRDAADPDIIVP